MIVVAHPSRSLQALHAAKNLEASLKRGFTTIRDAGGADWGLAIACETGVIHGPPATYPGPTFSSKDKPRRVHSAAAKRTRARNSGERLFNASGGSLKTCS